MHVSEDPKHDFWSGPFVPVLATSSICVLYLVHFAEAYGHIWHGNPYTTILIGVLLTALPVYIGWNWACRSKWHYKNTNGETIIKSISAQTKRKRKILVVSLAIPFIGFTGYGVYNAVMHRSHGCSGLEKNTQTYFEKVKPEIHDTLAQIILFTKNEDSAAIGNSMAAYKKRLVERYGQKLGKDTFTTDCIELFQAEADSLIGAEITSQAKRMFALSGFLNNIITYRHNDFDTFLDRALYRDDTHDFPELDAATTIIAYRTADGEKQGFWIPGNFKEAMGELHIDKDSIAVIKYSTNHAGKVDTLFIKYKR